MLLGEHKNVHKYAALGFGCLNIYQVSGKKKNVYIVLRNKQLSSRIPWNSNLPFISGVRKYERDLHLDNSNFACI